MNEDNRLIAEFMGWRLRSFPIHMKTPFHGSTWWFYYTTPTCGQPACLVGKEHFHESWEWLMPVVEKIEKIFDEHDGYYGVYISSNSCTIEGTLLHKALKDTSYGPVYYNQVVLEDKLSSTYQAVVLFIKWYNANKK